MFISHLHGDHVLGIPGLLNTLSLYERNFPLKLFAPSGLKEILDMVFSHTQSYLNYPLEFYPLEAFEPGDVIFQTDRMEVSLLPLEHRIFCRGFKFREINKPPKFDFYKAKTLQIPNPYFRLLKLGNNVTLEDGRQITPDQVLSGPDAQISYAYCSDTKYSEALIDYIEGSHGLYHEATFLSNMEERATLTYHSTARQAASIAQQAGVKRLYLGHYSARYLALEPLLEEARAVFPAAELAREGMIIDLADL